MTTEPISKRVVELQRELQKAEQRAEWEAQNPEAIKDAFERGKELGFVEGWESACRWLEQMAIHCGDLHHTTAPEPTKESLERIADMLSVHSSENGR